MSVREDAQKLDPGAVVALFTLDATAVGGAVHRFVTGPWNGARAVYGGLAYSASPIELTGLEYRADGPSPRPKLVMSRLDAVVAAAALDAEDWRGARLTRVRTLAQYLDGQPKADPDRHWPEETFLVERLAEADGETVTWQLASPIDFEGRRLPGRQILRDVCNWRYREWRNNAWDYTHAECPYVGAAYFDAGDDPAADASDDVCSRRVSGCKARFPGEDLPFGGFLGAGRIRA